MVVIFIVSILAQRFPTPSYVEDVYENDFDASLEINSQLNLETKVNFEPETIISGNRTRRAFFRCLLTLETTEFTQCYAFGQGFTFGSGGGVYLSSSNMYAGNCTWHSNTANIGGALSGIGSNVMIWNNSFYDNYAYNSAGAISLCYSTQGIYTEIDDAPNQENIFDNEPQIQISNAKFDNNVCELFAGAVNFVRLKSADLIDCEFINNCASVAGGALVIDSTSPTFVRCSFLDNKMNINNQRITNQNYTIHNGKFFGGGAIALNSFHNKKENRKYQLNTVNCIFGNNFASAKYTHELGGDILFSGTASLWRSIEDCFSLNKNIAGDVVKYIEISSNCPDLPDSHADSPTSLSYPTIVSISYDTMSAYPEPVSPNITTIVVTNSPLPTPDSIPFESNLTKFSPFTIDPVTPYTTFPPCTTLLPTQSKPYPSQSKSPSMTEFSKTPTASSQIPSSMTITLTNTTIVTSIITQTDTLTESIIITDPSTKYTTIIITTYIISTTETVTQTETLTSRNDQNQDESKGISTAWKVLISLFVVVFVCILGLCYVKYRMRKKYGDFTSTSNDELRTSFIPNVNDLSSYTNDNPIMSESSLMFSNSEFDPDFSEGSQMIEYL